MMNTKNNLMCTTKRPVKRKRRVSVSFADTVVQKSFPVAPATAVSFKMHQKEETVPRKSFKKRKTVSFSGVKPGASPAMPQLCEISILKDDTSLMMPGAGALETLSQELQKYTEALALIKTHETRIEKLENKNEELVKENSKLRDILLDTMLGNNSASGNQHVAAGDDVLVGGGTIHGNTLALDVETVSGAPTPTRLLGNNDKVSGAPTPTRLHRDDDMGMPTPVTHINNAPAPGTPLEKTVLRKKKFLSCPTAPKTGFGAVKSKFIKGGHAAPRLSMNFFNEPEIFD